MMGHNICLKGVIWKIIPKLSLFPLLIWSAAKGIQICNGGVSHNFSQCCLSNQQLSQVIHKYYFFWHQQYKLGGVSGLETTFPQFHILLQETAFLKRHKTVAYVYYGQISCCFEE